MILLIDAFNLIYKFPELEESMARGELENAMAGLVRRLEILKRNYGQAKKEEGRKRRIRNLELHIFFDGKRRRGDETRRRKFAGMELYYSHDLSADHLIMEFIRRNPAPGDLCVVSTDKSVREFARVHRCQRRTSEEFALWVESVLAANETENATNQNPESDSDGNTDFESNSRLSPDEVAYWAKIFRE